MAYQLPFIRVLSNNSVNIQSTHLKQIRKISFYQSNIDLLEFWYSHPILKSDLFFSMYILYCDVILISWILLTRNSRDFRVFHKHLYRVYVDLESVHMTVKQSINSVKTINWFNKNIKQAVCCHEDQTTVWQNFYFLINDIDVCKQS